MHSVSIVRAAVEDAGAILQLQREAYESEARLYGDWSIPPLTQTVEQLRGEFVASVVLKAITSERGLLGSVRAREDKGIVQVGRLIVAPSAQRQGIGGALLREIEAAFRSAQRFELFTGSLSEGNIKFYSKHGYSVTHQKALSPGITLVFMSKPSEAAA